jgi:hypothetical protein
MRDAYLGAIFSFSLRGAQHGGPAAWQGCTLAAELLPSLSLSLSLSALVSHSGRRETGTEEG